MQQTNQALQQSIPSQSPPAPQSSASAPSSALKKVLIIEDEQPMAKVLQIKLQKSGFEAKAVFDGQAGIAELDTGVYDVALLDIMMPKVDGWQVLSHVKEKGIKTKIIVTSNLSQEEDKKKAEEMGAVDFLVKSDESLAEIVTRVTQLLKTT